jgi:hypothetical protein
MANIYIFHARVIPLIGGGASQCTQDVSFSLHKWKWNTLHTASGRAHVQGYYEVGKGTSSGGLTEEGPCTALHDTGAEHGHYLT